MRLFRTEKFKQKIIPLRRMPLRNQPHFPERCYQLKQKHFE